MSARTFSEAIGESPTNTQNYVGSRNAEPRASYLENVMRHFTSVNPLWLLTGEGEPFNSNPTHTENSSATLPKNKNFSHSQVISSNTGSATQHMASSGSEQLLFLQRENELLKEQLAEKERTIQILLHHQPPKP